jgi:hypothetical protein
MLPAIAGMTGTHHHGQLFLMEMETHDLFFFFFCSGCPGTMILLISASHIALITGVNHWHPDNM